MFPSLSSVALGATLLLAVADDVPALNVEPGCRAAARMGDRLNSDASLRQCLADEKGAREELEKEWAQFSPALRQRCVATTYSGGSSSYVEVLVCLQMARDAAKLDKSYDRSAVGQCELHLAEPASGDPPLPRLGTHQRRRLTYPRILGEPLVLGAAERTVGT